MAPKKYDHDVAKAYCEKKALVYDWSMAEKAEALAARHKLTQPAFTAAIVLHVDAMCEAFTPSRYSAWNRFKMGLGMLALFWGLVKPSWGK